MLLLVCLGAWGNEAIAQGIGGGAHMLPVAGQSRAVSGKILTSDDAPIPQAVVYLKNTKTLAVTTFISDQEANYRFQNLTPNTDYEIYAETNGHKSATKTLSAFDTRANVTLNLHIDMKK
jgi:hypothetical protein